MHEPANWKRFARIYAAGVALLLAIVVAVDATLYLSSLLLCVLTFGIGLVLPAVVWLCHECGRVRELGPDSLSRSRAPNALPCVVFCCCMLGVVFGLVSGIFFVAPWYSLVALGECTVNVESNDVAAECSIYSFAPAATVDVARVGVAVEQVRSRSGAAFKRYTCVAPLVTALNASSPMLYYWAVAYGECCTQTASCDAWISAIGGGYRALAADGTVWRDASALDAAIAAAAVSTNQSALAAGAHFFVTTARTSADARSLRDRLGKRGLWFAGAIVLLWPLAICALAFPVELLAMLKNGKMMVLDVFFLVLFEKHVDSRASLAECCCPTAADKYRIDGDDGYSGDGDSVGDGGESNRVVELRGDRGDVEMRRDAQFDFPDDDE